MTESGGFYMVRMLVAALAFCLVGIGALAQAAQDPLRVGCMQMSLGMIYQDFVKAHPQVSISASCPKDRSWFKTDAPEVFEANLVGSQLAALGPGVAERFWTIGLPSPGSLDTRHALDLNLAAKQAPALGRIVSALPPRVRAQVSPQGRLLAIPLALDPIVYGVRTDVYRDAGLAVPTDWDWATFTTNAQKAAAALDTSKYQSDRDLLKIPRAKTLGAYLPSPSSVPFWQAMFSAVGQNPAAPGGAFDTKSSVTLVRTIQDRLDSGAIGIAPESGSIGLDGEYLQFGYTAAAPLYAGSLLTTQPGLSAQLGVSYSHGTFTTLVSHDIAPVPLPHPPGVAAVPTPVGIESLVMSAQIAGDHVAAAGDFIAWVVSHAGAHYHQGWGLPPTEQQGLDVFGPAAAFYYRVLANAQLSSQIGTETAGKWTTFARDFPQLQSGTLTADGFARLVDAGGE